MATRTDIRQALVAGFTRRLADLPDHLLDSLWPQEAETLGARAVSAALAPRLWADVAGERIDTATLVDLLGISRQSLAKRNAAGTLLGLPGKGTTWYPVWQFDRDADPIRVRRLVADVFSAWVEEIGTLDPYAVAAWATTRQPELHDLTPIEFLDKGQQVDGDRLVAVARIAASGLAQ